MEKYISPEMDINVFAADDVVTASGGSGCSVDKVVTPGLCTTEGLCLFANTNAPTCGSDTCNDAW